MKWRNLITAVLCASAVPALAQSTASDRIKSAYVACVQAAFVHHLGAKYIADGNVAAAIEPLKFVPEFDNVLSGIGMNYNAVEGQLGSSRPEEFHPRALPEPCVTLSSHTAPDVRPLP
jgi:hypothetical protein